MLRQALPFLPHLQRLPVDMHLTDNGCAFQIRHPRRPAIRRQRQPQESRQMVVRGVKRKEMLFGICRVVDQIVHFNRISRHGLPAHLPAADAVAVRPAAFHLMLDVLPQAGVLIPGDHVR